MKQPKITALYERLSRDDEQAGESNSILAQKKLLENYARQNGFPNPVHFTDDGHSGKDFERPGWKAMIAEIESGHIDTVICKDMSRIGRDYLQTGFYTEVFFREKGIHFIAVANNIDSKNKESGEFAPFLNIMSEWYLRDASRKVKASHKARGMSGKRLTFNPIYGYRLDPGDKNKWVIDPEAAEVVKRIFTLTIEGKGPFQIGRILSEERVERPSYYLYTRGIVNLQRLDHSDPYAWSGNSIMRMIGRPEYAGDTVNFRTSKDSYKDKQIRYAPKEDWVIFENTHPAIVDKETWETAQRCRKTKRRIDSLGEANPLTGLLYCADCGRRMYNHRTPYPTTYLFKGKTYNRCPSDFYTCSTYMLSGSRFNRKCTTHNIRTVVLRKLILEAIQLACGFAKNNEAEFVQRLREESAIRQDETVKSHRKRITKGQRRVAELNTLIRKIYEDMAIGSLSPKRFEILSAEYEKEQAELEESIARLQAELDDFNTDSVRADGFIKIVKRYTDFSELTTPMINEFIEKIVVYQADRSSGECNQQVDIYLNFIGKFVPPETEPTPEQLAEEEKERKKRARHREAQRRYSEKKKREAV